MTRPWAKRAEELQEQEGMYADIVAWEEWVQEKLGVWESTAGDELWDEMSLANWNVRLYSIMCELCDNAVESAKERA